VFPHEKIYGQLLESCNINFCFFYFYSIQALKIINKRLVRKSLDMIREIESADDEGASYVQFWNNFGKYLKVNC